MAKRPTAVAAPGSNPDNGAVASTLAGATTGAIAALSGVFAGAATGTAGAAAMTSGLATVGSVVGGGMAAGILAVAAAPVAFGAAAYGGYRLYKRMAQPKDMPSPPKGKTGAAISTVAGTATGATAAIVGVSAGAATGTAGAAAITSGLAAVGGLVGGGMAAGIVAVAAAPVALGAVGYGAFRLFGRWRKP